MHICNMSETFSLPCSNKALYLMTSIWKEYEKKGPKNLFVNYKFELHFICVLFAFYLHFICILFVF